MTSQAAAISVFMFLTLFGVFLRHPGTTTVTAATVTGVTTGRRLFDTPSPSKQDLRAYFNCPPCDETQCDEVPADCPETVMELGVCACCSVCALAEGTRCGVYSKPCRKGLKCLPDRRLYEAGDEGVRSLFYGEGLCQPVSTSAAQQPHTNGKFRFRKF
jgi:hypothetical protein